MILRNVHRAAYESVFRRTVAGDLNKSIDRTLFGKLNVALDDFIDMKEEGEEEEEEEEAKEAKEAKVTFLSRYAYCSFLSSYSHVVSLFLFIYLSIDNSHNSLFASVSCSHSPWNFHYFSIACLAVR